MAEEFRRIWSFIEKAEPAQEMLSVLVPGEYHLGKRDTGLVLTYILC